VQLELMALSFRSVSALAICRSSCDFFHCLFVDVFFFSQLFMVFPQKEGLQRQVFGQA
jgi:hypothetical protein